MIEFEEVLSRVKGVRRRGPDQAEALCPGHDDRENRSLSITRKKGGGVLLHCFVGCTWEQITSTIGLSDTNGGSATRGRSPLTLEDFSAAKGLPVDFLVTSGIRQEDAGLGHRWRQLCVLRTKKGAG